MYICQTMDDQLNWYALRAFKGRVLNVKGDFESAGCRTYMAMQIRESVKDGHHLYRKVQIVPQLLFVRCTEQQLKEYKDSHFDEIMVYRHKVKNDKGEETLVPAAIPEEQMKLFMFITSVDDGKDVDYYGEVMPHFEEGERVEVTDGLYKGATGYVKRIKKDRKLLVAIEGVAVVAISNIPMSYLVKSNNNH